MKDQMEVRREEGSAQTDSKAAYRRGRPLPLLLGMKALRPEVGGLASPAASAATASLAWCPPERKISGL